MYHQRISLQVAQVNRELSFPRSSANLLHTVLHPSHDTSAHPENICQLVQLFGMLNVCTPSMQ
jgi:hypothetical protein